jgi:antitoxin ParD1/3/4
MSQTAFAERTRARHGPRRHLVHDRLTTATAGCRYTRIWYTRAPDHRPAMTKNTSFILGDHFDAFVATQVATGRYANATDVIRSGLRLLEEHEHRLHALRQALIDGEESGVAGALDIEKVKRRARRAAGRGRS